MCVSFARKEYLQRERCIFTHIDSRVSADSMWSTVCDRRLFSTKVLGMGSYRSILRNIQLNHSVTV